MPCGGKFPSLAEKHARDDHDVSNVHSKLTLTAGLRQGLTGRP